MPYKHRPTIIFVILTLILGLFWLRLAYWQIIRQSFLTQLFNRQSQKINLLPVPRGQIITADQKIIAYSQPVFDVGFNPKNCPNQTLDLITRYLQYKQTQLQPLLKNAQIASQSAQPPLFNYQLINQITNPQYWQKQQTKLIQKANHPKTKWIPLGPVPATFLNTLPKPLYRCLAKIPSFQRLYPNPDVKGHLTGFVGKNNQGQDVGYFGLEGFYDNELTGTPGQLKGHYDALGNPLPQEFNFIKPPIPGRNLHLSIQSNLQYLAFQTLKEGVQKYQAQQGSVIIINPQTMQVLAIASYPSYNPNFYRWYKPEAFVNPAVASLYEPGSTFKVLIMALALDLKLVTPQTQCPICAGPLTTSGGTIRTWDNKYHPNSTMTQVIINSDNVGMAFVASKIGKEKLFEFLIKTGFGQKTGIDLQEDPIIPLKPLNQWYPIDLLTAGFGQGISLTPMKLTQLVAVIARGGKLTNPLITSYLTDPTTKRQYPVKHQPETTIFSPQTTQQITQMMIRAVDEGGAKWAKPANLTVAGKTGTAQVAVKGKYDPTKTIASFVGFWPVENPKYLILVKLDYPQTSPWGSETAAPLFFKLAQKIRLLNP